MHIGGIIAEYNPFHNGHKAHINSVRTAGATHLVAVMSGSFAQRGEPAVLTKFDRARMALACGVDLVLENPLPFAMASAERFATGGVGVLHALGCVDTLSFGSECGDVIALMRLAELADTVAYTDALRTALADGIPYAAAKQAAATSGGDAELAALLAHPNNTLGLEYIRAAKKLGAPFTFHTLARVGAAHDTDDCIDNITSASHIRTLLHCDENEKAIAYMPTAAAKILADAVKSGRAPTQQEKLEGALLARLRTMSAEDFRALPYISEGLDNRLFREVQTAQDYSHLLDALKTRRYPTARLRRILWAALLGVPSEETYPKPLYIRVLAMNDRGREILAAAKPTLPIVTRAAQTPALSADAQAMLALETRATDLHALALPAPLPCGTDWTNRL